MAACREGKVPGGYEERLCHLFRFVRRLTLEPWAVSQDDVDALRALGWTDPEIAEAVYTAALFAFFNRLASAFGLEDPRYEERRRCGDPDVPPAEQPPPRDL